MECKHYKRGDLYEKNCNHVCRDEIVLVDELGNLYLRPIHNTYLPSAVAYVNPYRVYSTI